MKKFLFITDFDGTVTAQDFFLQILYRYKPEKAFFKTKKRGFELLSDVFSGLNLTESELLDEISHVAFDPSFIDCVKFIKNSGGKVLVLSAGAHYYVKNKLKMEKLDDFVDIVANESIYNEEDGGIKLIKNEQHMFHDEVFGVNKLKIVEYYRRKFEVLAYAGDSYVDFDACRLCDFRFTKNNLAKICDMFYVEHRKFDNFLEVKVALEEEFEKI